MINDCDREIRRHLEEFKPPQLPQLPPPREHDKPQRPGKKTLADRVADQLRHQKRQETKYAPRPSL